MHCRTIFSDYLVDKKDKRVLRNFQRFHDDQHHQFWWFQIQNGNLRTSVKINHKKTTNKEHLNFNRRTTKQQREREFIKLNTAQCHSFWLNKLKQIVIVMLEGGGGHLACSHLLSRATENRPCCGLQTFYCYSEASKKLSRIEVLRVVFIFSCQPALKLDLRFVYKNCAFNLDFFTVCAPSFSLAII